MSQRAGKVNRMALWMVMLFLFLIAGPLWTLATGRVPLRGDWRTASQRSTGLAPDPATHREAIVQVYASRAFGWRGAFGVHTWLAAKPKDADHYTRYEVIGWFARAGQPVISISSSHPADAEWYGAAPMLLCDRRGEEAEAAIAKLEQAVASYPHALGYSVWPGPNSNTFIAHLGREIPELKLTMPSIAIGKDYLPLSDAVKRTPSGTGYQFSLLGLLGASAARDEGIEINVLGLVIGIDLRRPALKLPGLGRVPSDSDS